MRSRKKLSISIIFLLLFLILQTSSAVNNFQAPIDEKLIGSNGSGNVTMYGPIGNPDSKIKIAYIIGVHPPEFKVHDALFNILTNKNNLNYCYYIYKINVYDYIQAKGNNTQYDGHNNSESSGYRMEGQEFGRDFVVPDVVKADYLMVVDVHSNHRDDPEDWGNFYSGGGYDEGNFIFTPSNESSMGKNYLISREMVDYYLSKNPQLKDYIPRSQTSPSYVTIPIMSSGKRVFIYETYVRDPSMYGLLEHFLDSVDNTSIEKFGLMKHQNDSGTENEVNQINMGNVFLNKTGFPLFLLFGIICFGIGYWGRK